MDKSNTWPYPLLQLGHLRRRADLDTLAAKEAKRNLMATANPLASIIKAEREKQQWNMSSLKTSRNFQLKNVSEKSLLRDFYYIDYAVAKLDLDLKDPYLIELVTKKLKVPDNDPIDISHSRKAGLQTQLDTRLKPVLRPQDFDSFDLNRAFELIAEMGSRIVDKG